MAASMRSAFCGACHRGPLWNYSSSLFSPTRVSSLRSSRSFSSNAFSESFSSAYPVQLCEKVLLTIHESCGAPWWGTIVITVVTLRSLITVPFTIIQRRMVGKGLKYKPELDKLAAELAAEVKMAQSMKKWTDFQASNIFKNEMKRHTREFYIKHNCHPAKAFILPWFQIPLWISLSFALRNLCGGWGSTSSETKSNGIKVVHQEFATGGTAWFPDLTQRDTTWAIPILYGFFSLLIGEMYGAGVEKKTKLVKIMLAVSRVTSVLLVPIAAAVPSAISFYWLTSVVFGVFQFLLLMSPRILKFLRIPPVVVKANPYRDMISRLLTRPQPQV